LNQFDGYLNIKPFAAEGDRREIMSKLSGKTAVVTGASKGIGAAIAKALAAEGAAVAVNYASSREGADKVVAEITAAGGKAIAVQASVASGDDVTRLFDETQKAFGGVDILVNNAGVYAFAPIEDFTEAEYRRQFDTNVLGLLLATQEAAKRFRRRWRQRDQHQLGGDHGRYPDCGGLHGHQGLGGLDHSRVRQGAGSAQDPRQRHLRPARSRPKARIPWASSAAIWRHR
jgi:NAD(P)-dependent dehydrogenase (short-subunit alcohol dehydrogenase family)